MAKLLLKRLAASWRTVHADGDGGAQGGGDGGAQGGGDGGAQGGGDGGGAGAQGDDDKPTISQKKLNSILATEKRKHQEDKEKTIKQLETLQKAKGLSDKEKESLSSQIDELKRSMLTKEELALQEKKKLELEMTGKLKESETRAQRNWRLYEESTIKRSISDAASKHDAFRSSQIVKHLEGFTELVEDKDDGGTGLGTYTPRVKFPDTKDGKPIVLDLTVDEAVKRMKDLPEEYGNLFKSGVSGGLGATGGTGGGRSDEGPPKDPNQYRAWRERQKKAGKL